MQATYMEAVKVAQRAMSAGKYQAAINGFARAIEIDATMPLAHVNLAETLLLQGSIDAALESAREAVRRRPNFGRSQWALALCLSRYSETLETPSARTDAMNEALACYEKAREINTSIDAIPELDAWRQSRQSAEADALRASNQAARIRRWDETRERHGLAHVTFGDTTEAAQAILAEEATTESGKRWKSEYNYAKRKY